LELNFANVLGYKILVFRKTHIDILVGGGPSNGA